MDNKIRLTQFKAPDYKGRGRLTILSWNVIQATVFRFSYLNRVRRWLLRMYGANIGIGVLIRPTAKFTYPWKVTIGDHSWIGDHACFYSLDEITIGSHCVISQNAYLCAGTHAIDDPAFGVVTKPIVIRDGAWIASDVFVFPGVTVNEMGVAGARSTVIRDIPANEVHVGYPAKYIKQRFSYETTNNQEIAASICN